MLRIPGAIWAAVPAVLSTLAGALPAAAYQNEIHGQAQSIMATLGQTERKAVAVVDFTDLQGNVTELGRFLAEELSVALSTLGREPGVTVIDRTHLKAILAEHKLSASGLMDPQAARRVAAIAGVDALVTGTVTPLGDSVRLTVKVLDVGNARIVAATSVDIPRTQAIAALLEARIEGGTGSPTPAPQPPRPGGGPAAAEGAGQSIEADGVRFDLQKCRLSGGEVACSLLVTSLREDVKIHPSGLRSFDESGDEHKATRFQIGLIESRAEYLYHVSLIAGVPVRGSWGFQGIAAGTRKLLVIEFWLGDTKVQFRDVPLAS